MVKADTDNIALRRTNGRTVLFDYRVGSYFPVNETALFIWKQLTKKPKDTAEIVNALVKNYSVAKARATADVQALLREWKKAGLVLDCA